jgi:hypothetical protein
MSDLDPAAIMAEHYKGRNGYCVACGTGIRYHWPCLPWLLARDLAEAQERAESEARCRRSNSRSARLLIDAIGRDEPEVVAASAAVEAGDWSDEYDFGHIAIAYITRLRAERAEAQERERRVRAVVSDWRSVILTMRDRDDGPRTIRLDQYLEGRAEAINRALDGPARSKT